MNCINSHDYWAFITKGREAKLVSSSTLHIYTPLEWKVEGKMDGKSQYGKTQEAFNEFVKNGDFEDATEYE